ncbi:serine/threonine receptor-like kinase NFP [Canna indica]|uniref:Serine/threonine receptor-like kinase NFP n=1 Tax=Canna indica TaxID=4628 RepID=A0AAQ3KFC3_9LILI|nr:serine/threonine receptor-like kinase NFP [Canna indica]
MLGLRANPARIPLSKDLASIGDLFGVSCAMIVQSSNLTIAESSRPLCQGELLLVPITCNCDRNRSYASAAYQIVVNDTFCLHPRLRHLRASTGQHLRLGGRQLRHGRRHPDRHKRPGKRHVLRHLHPSVPNPPSPAANSRTIVPSEAPALPPTDSAPVIETNENKGVIAGLTAGLALVGVLCVLQFLLLIWCSRRSSRKGEEVEKLGSSARSSKGGGGLQFGRLPSAEDKLIGDISEWLDKYKVFTVEELRLAMAGFAKSHLLQGSVYKGTMEDEEVLAVKKMKWNACDELKIPQKAPPTYLVYTLRVRGERLLDTWLYHGLVTTKMNVFAFGGVLLELVTGREAVNEDGESLWSEAKRVFGSGKGEIRVEEGGLLQ